MLDWSVSKWAEVMQIVGSIAILLGILALAASWRQIERAQKTTRIQLMLAIDEAFYRFRCLRRQLITKAYVAPELEEPPSEELVELRRYMTVFERVAHALRDGLIDIETAETQYGRPLKQLLEARNVREKHIEPRLKTWTALVYLWCYLYDFTNGKDGNRVGLPKPSNPVRNYVENLGQRTWPVGKRIRRARAHG
jgi:hypothetical protein